MKNRINTNTYRTIKKSFPRFLSLMIMSLLGVLVFVGLSSTSPDMLNTLDNFFDKADMYDIKIISTLGLTDNDLDKLQEIDTIEKIEGSYSKDLLIKDNETEFVLNISSLPVNINKIELIEGRLPINDNEIVVEENLLKKLDYELNDIIELNDETFKNKEVTIVGTIRSSLYFNNTTINQNRGATNIGTGTINYYSYMLPTSFDVAYYSNIYITVKNAKPELTSTNSYNNLITNTITKIETIKAIQEEKRYNDIYKEINDEITEEENKVNEELNKAKKELNTAKRKLDNAKKELDSVNKQLIPSKKQLDQAKNEITKSKEEFAKTLKQYNINNITDSLNKINESISALESFLSTIDKTSSEYQKYQVELSNLTQQKNLLQTLKETENLINNSEKEYNKNYSQYQKGYNEYTSGLKEYNKNLKTYNNSYNEYEENKKKAENELTEAKNKLNDISKPSWYIYNRDDNQTYSSYINQTKSIRNLSGLFPVVFYAVAILVSLISMNRMVEDDRNEIGTLKSLGFSNHQIKTKYLSFSFLATISGAILGTIIGLTIIPYIIFTIYHLLFDVPNFQIGLNLFSTAIGIIIALICICGSSIITANRILKERPATLMRPKAPTAGKKILLENIKGLWHRIKFSNKITIRNIFRYKKRVLVTIFGICGCTALILCGFGIKDSIVDITNMQYVETFTYDATIYTKNLNYEDIPTITNNELITNYVLSEEISGTLNDSTIYLSIFENNDDISLISNLVTLENSKIDTLPNNKVIITDKLADIYDIKKGDKIKILDNNHIQHTYEVDNIVKNYLGHYIYMNKETLEKNGVEYSLNIIYINTPNLESHQEDLLSNELLQHDSIINVVHRRTLVNSAKDMLASLDKVVVILVLLSAMLSFVVLYNLSNINISERTREIATLKVLGFYDKEVDNYITKETVILTIIGIVLGLILGTFLTNITISTVEMENARFIKHIKINSYIYTAIISSFFTVIVNIVTHFTLKKINMIDSLKSVE